MTQAAFHRINRYIYSDNDELPHIGNRSFVRGCLQQAGRKFH